MHFSYEEPFVHVIFNVLSCIIMAQYALLITQMILIEPTVECLIYDVQVTTVQEPKIKIIYNFITDDYCAHSVRSFSLLAVNYSH